MGCGPSGLLTHGGSRAFLKLSLIEFKIGIVIMAYRFVVKIK